MSPYILKSSHFSTSWKEDAGGGMFLMTFGLPAASSVRFTILDGSGKNVRCIKENKPEGLHTFPVSVETLKKGKYSFVPETDFFTLNSTFVVEGINTVRSGR